MSSSDFIGIAVAANLASNTAAAYSAAERSRSKTAVAIVVSHRPNIDCSEYRPGAVSVGRHECCCCSYFTSFLVHYL